MQKFHLIRPTGLEITPSCGEELGGTLARLATAEEDRFRAIETASVAHWGSTVAQILYLAAEAFEAGAAASIGHKRSDRYMAAAAGHRIKAEGLEAEARAVRDAHESKRLLKAFLSGYEGRTGSGYAFDSREAYLVGKLFAQSNEPIPQRINKVYTPRPLGKDSPPDHLLVDGIKFIVIYPEGKTDEAFAKPIA